MCRSVVNDGSCSPWVMCSCSVVRGNQIRDSLNGVDINSKKCTNTIIRQIFYKTRSIKPRGKFFWNVFFTDIKWDKACSLPYRLCISNKVRELRLKILHNIYVSNYTLSKCMDIDGNCSFCSDQPEKLAHLFYECNYSKKFWRDLSLYVQEKKLVIFVI